LEQEEMKKMAGEKALDYVKDGMILGLGTGSTVEYVLKKLGELESGLYAYYTGRVTAGAIFSHDDIFIVNYLLEHPEFAKEMAQAGYDEVMAKHTWKTRIDQMMEIINGNKEISYV
jgi:ribose 5-phosphate isomerase A